MLSCKQFKFEVKLDEVRYEAEYEDVGGRERAVMKCMQYCLIFDTIIFVKSHLCDNLVSHNWLV